MTAEATPEPIQLSRILAIARRRGWIVLVCAIVGAASAFFVSHGQRKQYSSTSALLFQQSNLSQQLFGYGSPTTIDPTTQAATDINLVSQPQVAIATANALHLNAAHVTGEIGIAAAGASDVVNVTATDPSPTLAARLANTYATKFIIYRRSAERAQALEAKAQLQRQIARLRSTNTGSGQLPNLETRLSQLEVLASLQTGDVQLAQPALVPSSPSSPHVKRNTLLGLLAGLLVGLLAAVIAERIDQTVREPEDARDLLRLPLLGAVPSSKSLSDSALDEPFAFSAEAEAFGLLRTQLRYFNVDRAIQSVLVSSAAPGDGKSIVAWNLGRAAATLSVDSSVLLVDADLRRPSVSKLAGVHDSPGLAELLTQDLLLDDVIRIVSVDGSGDTDAGVLHVLTAGAAVPNPAELLESNKLRHLVAELHTRYSFIIFDTPPTSILPDAIPLMTQVSGVLVVVRVRKTRRPAIKRFREQLDDLGAHVLGLVLNDVPSSSSGYRDYGRYVRQYSPPAARLSPDGSHADTVTR
ncbi:MAG TPA: polysaccharide biosynthesis tyrosine autokinase [Solirubrobacteraceae bacterium]|nr:polysaccharide biosynthesis tyrosine autokinase [Solirubrobacteraceae bacterium]